MQGLLVTAICQVAYQEDRCLFELGFGTCGDCVRNSIRLVDKLSDEEIDKLV